jgi:hypothetical protein
MKARYLVAAVIFYTLLAGSALAGTATVQPQWVKQLGTPGNDVISKVITDPSGNVYVIGTTDGTIPGGVTVNGAITTANTHKGGVDVFAAKYDPQGNELWAVQFGSPGDDFAQGLAIFTPPSDTNAQIVYVSGWTTDALPGNTRIGGTDAFVAKLDAVTGGIGWIRQYGTSSDDFGYGAAVDAVDGSVYLVGSTSGNLAGGVAINGYSDAFIIKFDTYGYRRYANQFNVAATPLDNYAYDVVFDGSVNPDVLYVTGLTRANPSGSLFVAKFNTYCDKLGSYHTLGGPNNGSDNDAGQAIALDKDGNIIIAGYTFGSFDGNISAGDRDILVVKYDRAWNKLWSRQYGTPGRDEALGLAVDTEGSIYLTGVTGYPGGPGLNGEQHHGVSDMFLMRLAPDGRTIYTHQLGTTGQDWAYGIALDPSSHIYLAGTTEGTMGGQALGGLDAVLIKYDKDGPVPPPVTDFYINGTVREQTSGSPLSVVSIFVKDKDGMEVGSYTTDVSGQFSSKVPVAGKYYVHKLKIGYTAQVDPDEVEVTAATPTATLVSSMQKIVVKTEMAIRKGYSTIRFAKLPAGDRSVNAVFGPYAGNPYVGLIFSFDRPMQYLFLHGHKSVGNLKKMEFGRSYMIYSSKAFTIDTTYWVGPDTPPPATTYQGKLLY